MQYISPLSYFDSVSSPDGKTLLLNLVDAKDIPVTLLLDRDSSGLNYNQLYVNQEYLSSDEDKIFWVNELSRMQRETQLEYETEVTLLRLFIEVLENC